MTRSRIAIAATSVALLAAAAWGFGLFGGEDGEVEAIRQQMANRSELSEADQQAVRDRIRNLSDNQRQQLFRPMMQAGFDRMRQRYNDLLAMPDDQRRAELDRMIDQMEDRRREWEARRAEREANRGAGGGEGRGAGGGEGGRRGFSQMSEAERDQRRKGMLDRTSPEMRATVTSMMNMVNDRREERGMEPLSSPRALFAGGGFRGGRGGPR
ncbi:MAG: hypothetical protein AAGF31_10100 [Planctomycetota bacterium]